jgi:hypothetical protein
VDFAPESESVVLSHKPDLPSPGKSGFCMSEETTLPRYHFDLVDSKTVADEGGSELADDMQAMEVAQELARRLLRERPELKGRRYSILVTNQDGDEIGRCRLDDLH